MNPFAQYAAPRSHHPRSADSRVCQCQTHQSYVRTKLSALRIVTKLLCLFSAAVLLTPLASDPAALPAIPTVEVPNEAWVQCTDGSAKTVTTDIAGNVVVIGASGGECYMARYAAATGALLWEKRGLACGVNAAATDASGNVVVTGSSHIGSNLDCHTAKYAAADGAILWERRYNGSANRDDGATAVAIDRAGNVVVTGYSLNTNEYRSFDFYTAKYDAQDGTLLWERRYNGANNVDDFPRALALDSQGNVLVAGFVDLVIGCLGKGTCFFVHRGYVAKYGATDGRILWEQYGQFGTTADAITVDAADDVLVMGGDRFDCYTAKYASADAALLWERRSDALPGVITHATVAVNVLGDVIVAGRSTYLAYDFECAFRECFCVYVTNSYLAKYSRTGDTVLWERSDNHVISGRPPNLERIDSSLFWIYPENNGGEAMAVDTKGNVVVTGTHDGHCSTAKYAAADGALLWEKQYGMESHSMSSSAVAFGPDGSVVLACNSVGDNSTEMYATVKYVMTQVTYPTPVALALALASDGARLRFTGDAGRTYRLQRASNPAGPWTTFADLTAPPDGPVEHLDPASPSSPAFYRVAAP